MIITAQIRELVSNIESHDFLHPYLSELLETLIYNCNFNHFSTHIASTHSEFNPKTKFLPNDLILKNNSSHFYPVDGEGYAIAFDPLVDEDFILHYWQQYGFVVVKNVILERVVVQSLDEILNKIRILGINLLKEDTFPKDSQENTILNRGFFEIYHDDSLAQLRQSLRLYLYHVMLWNNPFLWTSFDRIGIKCPGDEGLNLHVDQNPLIHPEFRTIQGVLALVDCPVERGTFVVSPFSKNLFSTYSQHVRDNYKGEYVPLPECRYHEFPTQHIALRQGSMVSWDSRTTHANSSNHSQDVRYVAYISTGLAQEKREDLISKRKDSFYTGLGENVRDAYMHASKKPRFTHSEFINTIRAPEKLTALGQCLYGFKPYSTIVKDSNNQERIASVNSENLKKELS